MFARNIAKFHFKRAFANPTAVVRTSFRHNFTNILARSLARFLFRTKSTNVCQCFCRSKFLASGNKNKIDVHWLLAHFRKGGQAVLIRGRLMISQALRAGVISSAPPRHCTNPLPVKHLITIKDGGIESLIYLAFRSKITPALQAKLMLAIQRNEYF